MWTRQMLKDKAKKVLHFNYWNAFVVALLFALIGGGNGGQQNYFAGVLQLPFQAINMSLSAPDMFDGGSEVVLIVIIFLVVMVIATAIAIAYVSFLVNPFQVGAFKYFVDSNEAYDDVNTSEGHSYNRPESVSISVIGFSFGQGRYMKIVKSMFMTTLIISLWSLLFIIPGIIKGLAYSQVPYILADNPDMDYKRAMEISRQMTDGQKWDIFVLGLSFLGWILLGMIPCGLGVFFVSPYIQTTYAELYRHLRHEGIDQGICTYEELNFQMPE